MIKPNPIKKLESRPRKQVFAAMAIAASTLICPCCGKINARSGKDFCPVCPLVSEQGEVRAQVQEWLERAQMNALVSDSPQQATYWRRTAVVCGSLALMLDGTFGCPSDEQDAMRIAAEEAG